MYRFKPVIEAVDALGARDNTYIVFSTDNGAQGERWTSNRGGSGPNGDTSGAFTNAVGTQGPFRGCKASLYDGGHPSAIGTPRNCSWGQRNMLYYSKSLLEIFPGPR